MKTRRILLILQSAILLLVIGGCSGTGKLTTQNFAGFYKPELKIDGLGYAVFNLNDSVSNLYFRFPIEELNFQQLAGKRPIAKYRLDYQVFDGLEKGMLVDSGHRIGADSLLFTGLIEDSVSMKALTGKNYHVLVKLTDINLLLSSASHIYLQKSGMENEADFLLTDTDFKPLMRNYINRIEQVRIRARFPQDSILVLKHYSFPEISAANIPYAYVAPDESSDAFLQGSTSVRFNGNLSLPFNLKAEGVYLSANNESGVRVYRFYDGFPEIGSVDKMFETIRYISTENELAELGEMTSKAAVDKFWIDLAGNSERALNQIKRYYGRVEDANCFFSNTTEGWKSDRGMIYIVFGPPAIVYRNSAVEEWTYGEPGNPMSVKFYFQLSKTSIGIPDYLLIRMSEYRRPWFLAVSNWRR